MSSLVGAVTRATGIGLRMQLVLSPALPGLEGSSPAHPTPSLAATSIYSKLRMVPTPPDVDKGSVLCTNLLH